jgi:signal transduction histidine kinase
MLSALANGVLESSFRRYINESLRQDSEQVVSQMAAQRGAKGSWDDAGLTAVGMSALEQGLIVKLVDTAGRTVWDATVHNNGLCVQMISHMAQNMASRYPNFRGTYTEVLYPVRTDFALAGSVTVGYYGPFFLNDQELAFINSLNSLLLAVGAAALILATGVGLFMARRISVPLARVVSATQRIAEGAVYEPIGVKSGVRELDRIASAVNELSRSLAEQEALRRRLTADMAHELRTPLAALQSHVEALIDGVWEPEPARLGALHEEILRINRLVSDMEKLARLEGDLGALRRQPTDLAALCAAVVSNHEPAFREKGVTLRLRLETESGAVVMAVDPDRLSQAVINLLSNALKFTPSGGEVTVSVSRDRESARIAVTDTGTGIGAEHLPRIFERFYRVDSSRTRATGGSGIGLSIARAIVEAHGGTLSASSEPGRGSEFLMFLPATACKG